MAIERPTIESIAPNNQRFACVLVELPRIRQVSQYNGLVEEVVADLPDADPAALDPERIPHFNRVAGDQSNGPYQAGDMVDDNVASPQSPHVEVALVGAKRCAENSVTRFVLEVLALVDPPEVWRIGWLWDECQDGRRFTEQIHAFSYVVSPYCGDSPRQHLSCRPAYNPPTVRHMERPKMPDTSDPKAASPKSGDQRMSVEEEDYLATEEAAFLQPLEVLRRWANVARLLHESFQGRADEAKHQHLTREQLRDRLRDLHGEEVGTKTIERLLISFAIRVREQEATRNQEDVRADRAKNVKFKHPELPRDSHGGYYLRPDQNPIAVLYLSDEEARTLLFALRHLLHNAVEQQPALISLLAQLTTQFSGVIAAVATETMAQAHAIERKKPSSRPRPRHKELERLTTAWLKGDVVHLSYQSPWSPEERGWEPNDFENGCFQPLLLEPSRATGATYAVGYTRH